MQKGYLIFELKKDNGATPVENAQIKITNIDGREVNKFLRVDENGITEKFEMYTKDYRLTYDKFNNEIPYSSVDAEVRFENDKIIYVDGIQVYSNVTSVQEIKIDGRDNNFRSSKDKKGKNKKEHIHFKNNNPCIFEEISKKDSKIEFEDKETNSMTNVKNLIIPEFITVNIGDLNKCDEIITIPFIDYIKNVACSSIYPTWRDDAIRANVYSIVSFTLNRVHSKWYRSKGYGFEITNNENIDQMYVKGRNLFRNICNIVDECFDKCINVEGFNKPILTKCVNENESKNNLSRWGSFDLAEKGLSAIDILKRYYGEGINIYEIPTIEGVFKKYGGTELSKGSSGYDVKIIQKQLNEISKKYKGINTILQEDGVFGDDTEKAVKDFQSVFGINVDGIVGKVTWNRISLVYSLIKKIFGDVEDIDQEEQGFRELKIGSKGNDVLNIQKSINYIFSGYKFLPKLKEDGYYGNETKKAVEVFQQLFGLIVDGIVGKNTLDRIEYVKKNLRFLKTFLKSQVDNNKLNNMDENKRDYGKLEDVLIPLKKGDVGENVKILQRELNKLSNYYGFIEKISEDGVFGNKTQESLINFQKKFSLRVDGVFGKESLNKLIILSEVIDNLDLDKVICKEKTTPNKVICEDEVRINPFEFKSEFSMEYPNFDMLYGDTCGYITLAQKYINEIKLRDPRYFINDVILIEDGMFGDNTLKYIKEFQKKFNYNQINKIDKKTWDRLVMEYEKIYSK